MPSYTASRITTRTARSGYRNPLPVLFASRHTVPRLPVFDDHFTGAHQAPVKWASGRVQSGVVGLQGPALPTAYPPVGACRRLRACKEVALCRQDSAGRATNEKHHRVPGFQRRGTHHLE